MQNSCKNSRLTKRDSESFEGQLAAELMHAFQVIKFYWYFIDFMCGKGLILPLKSNRWVLSKRCTQQSLINAVAGKKFVTYQRKL